MLSQEGNTLQEGQERMIDNNGERMMRKMSNSSRESNHPRIMDEYEEEKIEP